MGRLRQVVLITAVAMVCAGCWPVPGQNADRTANNPFETGITAANVDQLAEKWTFALPNPRPINNPVVSPGGVHITVKGACAIATLDSATGQVRWSRDVMFTPVPGCSAAPFVTSDTTDPHVEGDTVSVAGAGLVLSAPGPPRPPSFSIFSGSFDVATGAPASGPNAAITEAVRGRTAAGSAGGYDAVQQRVVLSSVQISSPSGGRAFTVHGGIQGTATLGLDALYDASSGVLASEPGDATSGPGIRAYSLTEPRPGCGAPGGPEECPLWATPVDGGINQRPVLGDAGETVYAGTSAGTMYALDAATGAVRWTAPVGSAVTSSPALAWGYLFVPTASGDLVALDADNGDHRWSASTGSAIGAQPAVAGNVVVTGSDGGSLHAFAAGGCGGHTCPSLWTAMTGSDITGAPAISNGQLYVGTADGRVIAYSRP